MPRPLTVLLLTTIAILALAIRPALAAAEEGDPLPDLGHDTLAAALASEDLALQAWAAYRIGQLGESALISELLSALLHAPPEAERAAVQAKDRAVLDALIRLEAQLEAGELTTLAANAGTTELLILAGLQRELDVTPWVVPLVRELAAAGMLRRPAWVAACNLALRDPSPEAVAALIEDLVVDITLVVRDEGRDGGGRRASLVAADGQVDRRPGFPPAVRYRLLIGPEPGAVVLAEGPRLSCFRRHEFASLSGWGRTGRMVIADEYRVACLAELGGLAIEADETIAARRFWNHRWIDGAAYREAVADHMTREEGKWGRLRYALAKRGLVPADTALMPEWRLDVQDQRENPAEPLPDVQDLIP